MKNRFIANTLLLTATTQLLRLTGLIFISFLSGTIGAEGIGLYQLIFSVYFLASTLATSGISTAVARLTAESMGRSGRKSISDTVRKSVIISVFLGIIVGAALFFSSGFLGSSILRDERAILSLKILSFGLPFMSVSSCFRGYFFGVRKVTRPASQMIFEQAVQLIIIFSIMKLFAASGLEYACFAIAVSSTASEVISCAYGILIYAAERKRSCLAVVRESDTNRKMLSIAAPLAVSSYLRSGLRTAENILIPLRLRSFGMSQKDALSKFGLIGMVMPVLLFPSSFLTAIAAVLLPEMSEANVLGQRQRIKNMFSRVFQLTTILSLLFCGVFAAFSKELSICLFNNAQTGALLLILSPLVPLIYLDFIVDSMLSALNQQTKTMLINIIDYSLRIALILVLVPEYGFTAYICIFYFSTILNAFLSMRRLLVASDAKINYIDWVIKPLACIAVSGLAVKLIFMLFDIDFISGWLLALETVMMVAFYFIFLVAVRCIRKEDAAWFKGMIRTHRKYTENETAVQNRLLLE